MAKKKEKKAGKRMKKKELVKVLLEFFHTKQDEVLSLKYIFEQLHLTTHPLKMLCMDILSELSMDDYITEVDKHKYKLNNHGVEMTGTFQRKSNGKNSFIPEDGGEPIFIAERNSAHAMNNDKVKIALCAKRRRHDLEGQVIEILEHADSTFVGTLKVSKNYAFLLTENPSGSGQYRSGACDFCAGKSDPEPDASGPFSCDDGTAERSDGNLFQ